MVRHYLEIQEYMVYNKLQKYTFISLYSSFCQTLIDAPIENIKIRKIVNYENNKYVMYNNIFDKLYNNIYRGFIFNYIRNFIFVGFVYSFNKECDNKFISGGLGGMLGSILSQPIDYIKTQKQSNLLISYNDIIFNKHYIKYCMNGVIPRASMSFLSMGIGSFVYYFF